MATDKAWKVGLARQEVDFLEELDCFWVIGANSRRIAIQFLSKCNQYTEIGSFRQFR